MRKYNISANLVCPIEQLYDKATRAVQMNGNTREWFGTTVEVRQGCLQSPTLFNIFLEQIIIMSDALDEYDVQFSIGGRNITNLLFADDIVALAEQEQKVVAESLEKNLHKVYDGPCANGIQWEIKVKRVNIKEWKEWTLPAQLGQLKPGQDGKGLLRSHLW